MELAETDPRFLPMPAANDFLGAPSRDFRAGRSASADEELRSCVQQLLLTHLPGRPELDRRREKRRPYPLPFLITPVDSVQHPICDGQLLVIGRNVSELGVDFYHREPLPYRQVIASFDGLRGTVLHLLVDLSWCRFGKHRIYDSGGRFVRVVTAPLH
ncbi:MAG: hypothetical protein FJ295_14530 [Planctomycetes bacterium]|nr:hypothetical protein [Planctomycetota bacterium]